MMNTQSLSAESVTSANEPNATVNNVFNRLDEYEHEHHNELHSHSPVSKNNTVVTLERRELTVSDDRGSTTITPFIPTSSSFEPSNLTPTNVLVAHTPVLPNYNDIHLGNNFNNLININTNNTNNTNTNNNNNNNNINTSSNTFNNINNNNHFNNYYNNKNSRNFINSVSSDHLFNSNGVVESSIGNSLDGAPFYTSNNNNYINQQLMNKSSFSSINNDFSKPQTSLSEEMLLPTEILRPHHFHPGSLGTPTIIGALAQHPSMTNLSIGSFSSSAATSSYNVNSNISGSISNPVQTDVVNTRLNLNEFGDPVLPQSRELLKALAKECKPLPPWCVGTVVPQELHDEAEQFAHFCCPTQNEIKMHEAELIKVHSIIQQIWPGAKLCLMGPSAAGLVAGVEKTMHYYVANAVYSSRDYYDVLTSAAARWGLSLTFREDARGATCVTFIDANVEHKLCIRYGERAIIAEATANVFMSEVANNHSARSAYAVLLALLSQAKLLDDIGVTSETVGPEAIGIMLLSVLRSYDPADKPDAGRLLLDFLLTYGFETYFDIKKNSVDISGMLNPPAKVHTTAELSILDPGDRGVNLTPKFDKTKHLQAVFNYAYTALTQYAQLNHRQRKAQSALSTIIGGQPFWGRVLENYHQRVEPFYNAVHAKLDKLIPFV